jgi:hypothetical protein
MSIRDTPCPFGTTGSLEKAPHPTSNSAAPRGDYCIWLGTSHSITGAHPDSTLRRDVMSWEISQLTNFLPFRLHPSLSSSLSPPSLPPTPSLSHLFPSPSSLSSLYFAIPSLTSPSLSFYTLALPLFPSSPPFSFLFSFPIPPSLLSLTIECLWCLETAVRSPAVLPIKIATYAVSVESKREVREMTIKREVREMTSKREVGQMKSRRGSEAREGRRDKGGKWR